MNSIAFVFSSAPHGNSSGREGLDALLATLTLSDKVGIFFIGDGVFQILANQQPNLILTRNYITTFKILVLYHTDGIWICKTSMQERGLKLNAALILNAKPISIQEIYKLLSKYRTVLTF